MTLDPKLRHGALVEAFGAVDERMGSYVVTCKGTVCHGSTHELTIDAHTGAWRCARGVGGDGWSSLLISALGSARWEQLSGAPAPPARTSALDPLDAWVEVDGQVVERRTDRQGRSFDTLRFDGTCRLVRVDATWTEDETAPSGWSEERRNTYRLSPRGARPVDLVAPPGAAALLKLVDGRAGSAWRAFSPKERAMFAAHVERVSRPEVEETRRALGPHGELGWLCAPRTSVRGGQVLEADTTIAAPSELHDVTRYRLPRITDDELRRAGAFLVERLLRCDHAAGAFTLPLLGAFMAAPLWAYVATLDSWQRYVFWVQGPSGVGKSQLCRYFMSLWGAFTNPEGLTTWLSSPTYIEDLLHQVVGAPTLVADWKRANLTPEARAASMALVQAYADRSSRGRADARGRAQKRRPPRSALVVDGEDLPEGQQATLGRIVILKVRAIGETGRCATADDVVLPAELMALAPGVTARWIAWVQRNVEIVRQDLHRGLAELEACVESSSSNRSRVLRNYAVQIATVRSFLAFIGQEAGVRIDPALMDQAVWVHVELAQAQLALVREESAGELFLRHLEDLLRSGVAFLRSSEDHDEMESPWGSRDKSGQCVGVMEPERAVLFAAVALGIVNQHAMRTASTRIDFSLGAVEQQLVQDGSIRVDLEKRDPGSKARTRMWYLTYDQLGVSDPVPVPARKGSDED